MIQLILDTMLHLLAPRSGAVVQMIGEVVKRDGVSVADGALHGAAYGMPLLLGVGCPLGGCIGLSLATHDRSFLGGCVLPRNGGVDDAVG